jgi:hypothetical protein
MGLTTVQGRKRVADRPAFKWTCITGTEKKGTLLTAYRFELCARAQLLDWWLNQDIPGNENTTGPKGGKSRVLISKVFWRQPVCDMTEMSHANVHVHYTLAKKDKGTALMHASFFQILAMKIRKFDVRVMSGDFNLSVFMVVGMLRRQGLIIDLGGIFPWQNSEDVASPFRCDCSAHFLIGGCKHIKLRCSLGTFYSPVTAVAVQDQTRESDDAERQGGSSVTAVAVHIPGDGSDVFEGGQGCALRSYLPKDAALKKKEIEEMFKVSTDLDPTLNASTRLLPPWKQKAMKFHMFDRNKSLFTSGAHMPLSGYMGTEPRRSTEGLARRDQKEKAKLKAKRDARAIQRRAWGKGHGKTDGTTRTYERMEPVRGKGATPWSWNNANARTSYAPVGRAVWNGYQQTNSTGRDQQWGNRGWSGRGWSSNDGWNRR